VHPDHLVDRSPRGDHRKDVLLPLDPEVEDERAVGRKGGLEGFPDIILLIDRDALDTIGLCDS
jgi:hypothetical protein